MQTNLILKRYLEHVTQASLDILGSAVRGPTGEEALGEPEEEEVDKLFIDGEAVSRARGSAAIIDSQLPSLISLFCYIAKNTEKYPAYEGCYSLTACTCLTSS